MGKYPALFIFCLKEGASLMGKKTIKDVNIKGKRVLCRVDFNVPMNDGTIADDTRIRAAIPTIEYLSEQGAIVILVSHLGRPKGEVKKELSLAPAGERLSELIGKKVLMSNESYGEIVKKRISQLQEGEIILLENVRFYPGEEQNDSQLAKEFADLADIYVNDAFGTAHRAHVSTEGVAHYLPSVAGFLMEKEIDVLGKALSHPERPFTAVIGGAKVKDKIGVIDNLLDKVDHIIIGGGLAFTFIKAQGYEIGNSLLEEDKIELAKSFIEKAKKKGVQFHMPIDVVIADEFSESARVNTVDIDSIPAEWQALDIGPKTVELYNRVIQESKLVVWNGPMGVFEMKPFSNGTKAVAEALANAKETYSIIGGGDSARAVEQFGLADQMSHISTGGGASLEFMEGKNLPSIAVLDEK